MSPHPLHFVACKLVLLFITKVGKGMVTYDRSLATKVFVI